MTRKTQKKAMRLAWKLALVYTVAVLVRFAVAYFVSIRLYVMPDEVIYFKIAKSLFVEGRIAFDGNYINYDNILYPLLIAPLFGLPEGIGVLNGIHFLNALWINASIFPLFALAKRLTGSEKSAWIACGAGLILPDMLLSQYVLVESLLYPLFYLAVYLAYRALTDENARWAGYLLAVVAFLLYFAKISMMMIGLALLGALLFDACGRRVRARVFDACAGILLAGALALLSRAWTAHLIGAPDITYANLYTNLMGASFMQSIVKVLKGSCMYLFLFPIACGVLPFIVPIASLNRYAKPDRILLIAILVGMAFTAMGASYTTFLDGTSGTLVNGRISLRYVAPFLPLFVLYSLSPQTRGLGWNAVSIALTAYLALACALLTPMCLSGCYAIDNMLLACSYPETNEAARWALTAYAALLTLFAAFVFHKPGWTPKTRGICIGVLCVSLIAQSGAYMVNFFDACAADALLEGDVKQAAAEVRDDAEVLMLSTDIPYSAWTMALYAHVRGYAPTVYQNGFFNHLRADGSYAPYLPVSECVGVTADKYTPATSLIADRATGDWMEFAPGATMRKTDNGCFVIADLDGEAPLLRSAMAGHENGSVFSRALILLYDQQMIENGTVRLTLRLSASRDGAEVALASGTIPIGEDLDSASIHCPFDAHMQISDQLGEMQADIPVFSKEGCYSVIVIEPRDPNDTIRIAEYKTTLPEDTVQG